MEALGALSAAFLLFAPVIYFAGCCCVYSAAGYRGLNAGAWFSTALIATPLIAMLGVIATPVDFDKAAMEAKWEKVPPR